MPVPWCPAPQVLALESDEVHVWRASLDLGASQVGRLRSHLSPDEVARAGRFHFDQDRERFIAARGLLRVILGRYLDLAPDQLRFCYGERGKPSLSGERGGEALRFNLSHSRGLVLYAVTRGREIGIDLEHLNPQIAEEPIAERFFSPSEVATLRGLPPERQPGAFYACWTRKEAYLKARGDGLGAPLDQFDVTVAPGEPAALLGVSGEPEEAARWSLRDLAPGTGYAAAVAVEGHGWRLQCWDWCEE